MTETKELLQDVKKTSFKTLLVENVKYRTLLTRKYENAIPYKPKEVKKIKSFIPGTITKIYVKRNKHVRAGDKLLVLEAMKMRNDILSPVSGTIKQILVKEGARITKGEVLVELK